MNPIKKLFDKYNLQTLNISELKNGKGYECFSVPTQYFYVRKDETFEKAIELAVERQRQLRELQQKMWDATFKE